MKTEKKKPEHYVNNKEFTAAVVAHNISVKHESCGLFTKKEQKEK